MQQGDLLYQGQFVNGRPSQVPTKVNVLFTLVEPAGKKPPAKGAVVDEVPVLPVRAEGRGAGLKRGRQARGLQATSEFSPPMLPSSPRKLICRPASNTISQHPKPYNPRAQFTIGTPLASPITVAAQHQVPLTEEEKEAAAAAAAPPAKGAPRAAPPPAARVAITESATAGGLMAICGKFLSQGRLHSCTRDLPRSEVQKAQQEYRVQQRPVYNWEQLHAL